MATNASTWFYREPEHQAYLIAERVNHSFWGNRINAIHLDCTNAEPPFRMEGAWHHLPVTLEWIPNDYLIMTIQPDDVVQKLIIGVKELLGFPPTISYVNAGNTMFVEWYVKDADKRIQEIQGNPNYTQIKRYTK
ncbi:MAG: hypothetical protein JXQ72_15225 [Anaerolineae bacterium]|nr:hypothetical protein [Anaerolineae bacterium]